MGLVGAEVRATYQQAITSLREPADWLVRWFPGGRETHTGVVVNEEIALQASVVFACVRILAETVAHLPLNVYERLPDGGRRLAREHPLFHVLHDSPNADMTSFGWREASQGHLGTWGNAYSVIILQQDGQVRELRPLRPDRTFPERMKTGQIRYIHRDASGNVDAVVRAERMLHIPGLGFDGVVGYNPIFMMRQAIGLALGLEEYSGKLFRNQARPSGILKADKRLNEKARRKLKKSWEAYHAGLGDNVHRVAVLEEGLSWQAIGFPPEESQMLQSRKFAISEIARYYRMQLHKVQEMEKATFSNIEMQAIEHVVDTIVPWLARWEANLNNKLILPSERDRFFIAFLVDGLLRGDFESRMKGYAIARQWGLRSANDIAKLENWNPLPGEQGNQYLVPLNMVPADKLGDLGGGGAPPGPVGSSGGGRRRLHDVDPGAMIVASFHDEDLELRSVIHRRRIQTAHAPLIRRETSRAVRKEVRAIRRAARKFLGGRRDALEFLQWLSDFYRSFHEDLAADFLPVFSVLSEEIRAVALEEAGLDQDLELGSLAADYAAVFGMRYSESSEGQIRSLIEAEEQLDEELMLQAIEERTGEWEDKRPDQVAARETVQLGSAAAKGAWLAGGILVLRWMTFGRNCPFCGDLRGKVVSIRGNFKDKGTISEGTGRSPMKHTSAIGHPPLHRGCDCSIVPG